MLLLNVSEKLTLNTGVASQHASPQTDAFTKVLDVLRAPVSVNEPNQKPESTSRQDGVEAGLQDDASDKEQEAVAVSVVADDGIENHTPLAQVTGVKLPSAFDSGKEGPDFVADVQPLDVAVSHVPPVMPLNMATQTLSHGSAAPETGKRTFETGKAAPTLPPSLADVQRPEAVPTVVEMAMSRVGEQAGILSAPLPFAAKPVVNGTSIVAATLPAVKSMAGLANQRQIDTPKAVGVPPRGQDTVNTSPPVQTQQNPHNQIAFVSNAVPNTEIRTGFDLEPEQPSPLRTENIAPALSDGLRHLAFPPVHENRPIHSPQIAQAVAQQLAVAASKTSNGATELVLSPEELGRVRLSVHTQDGLVTLTITAERPETQDLMRRHLDMLAQEMRSFGFEGMAFSFSDHRGQDGFGGQEEFTEPDVSEQQSLVADIENTGSRTGLDLRL